MHYYKESHPPQRDCTRTKDPATHAQPHQASYCKELADGTCICYKLLILKFMEDGEKRII